MEAVDHSQYRLGDSKENVASIREYLFSLMELKVMEVMEVPLEGTGRDGKVISLRNKKGEIRWSSWEKTRRIFGYLGDIARVLACDKADLLYPEQFKVAARCDILKECKGESSALENIKRLTGQIEGFIPKLEKGQQGEAALAIGSLTIPEVDSVTDAAIVLAKLDSIISGASLEEKETIKGLLFDLGCRHYPVAE
jgi:hypothetical protein